MTRRTILTITILLVATGCTAIPVPSSPSTSAAPPTDGTEVTVIRVIDGDTMDIEYGNGTTERVRLLGVDTPETHTGVAPGDWEGVPDSPAGRECLGTWGDHATQYATQELAGETVTLVLDPESDTRGGYGRLLGYLAYNGSTFNRRLLETGHARMYDSQFSLRATYAAIERSSMANETGAWTCRTPSTPESGDDGGGDGSDTEDVGATDVPLSISVHADAAGPDGDNLNDEYVTLTNTGDSNLTVTGWTIVDAADHSYEFGEHTIAPGVSLTLHTGSGTGNATDAYWGSASPIWNNDGDTATVRNESGATVAQATY